MIKNLIKAAAELDQAGFHVEADIMDKIMQKVAEKMDDDNMEDAEESEEMEHSEFGFLGHKQEDSEDEDSEEEYEEEMEEDSEEHSVEECLEYCKSFSNEEKIKLIKSLLDSMMD